MRISLNLLLKSSNATMPINYNHLVSSLIYYTLKDSSADYSQFLHDEGYALGKRRFKLFTFSNLQFKNFRIEADKIQLKSGIVKLFVSSMVPDFILNFAQGILRAKKIHIAGVPLEIKTVDVLPEPEFKKTMRFTALSPITVSAPNSDLTSLPHYLRYDEPGFSDRIRDNLIKKYKLLNGKEPEDSELVFEFDREYIEKKKNKIQKKITYKGTEIIAFMAPFKVTGSIELIRTGYETGFGEKGSMGFGMAKVVRQGRGRD